MMPMSALTPRYLDVICKKSVSVIMVTQNERSALLKQSRWVWEG